MFKPSQLALALLATTTTVAAQQLPNAGTQLQQLPRAPTVEQTLPDLRVERPPSPAEATDTGPSVQVQTLHITGQTVFPEAALLAATGFATGAALTLSQLRALAAHISDYYHVRGYFVAQAYLPAQDIGDGAVTIDVIEGHYGAVEIRNPNHVADGTPARILRGIAPGDLVTNRPLERRLLLMSDIPGVRVRGTMAPGTAVGTSDLAIDITRGPRIDGDVEVDNGGNRYTGTYRFGGTINLNDPFGIGDRLSLRGLASDGGLAYVRAAYQAPVGKATVGVAYEHLNYKLGREFAPLDGRGTVDTVSIFGSYPLIRSRRQNLWLFASADYRFLEDEIRTFGIDSRRRIEAGTIGIAGDSRDRFWGGGSNAYSLSLTAGNLDIRSPFERNLDATTAHSAGGYAKVQASVSRLQSVAGPFSLFGSARGQYAFNNLDTSEKMELGGAYGVRAYPEGESFGDSGYIATLEGRLALGGEPRRLPGRFELIAFVETGTVWYSHNPWFPGSNHANRSAYGVGLNWAGPEGLLVRTAYARKLGTGPATSAPDRSGRFWFQVVKLF